MEFKKAKDKALEIGRGLLRRARGENDSEGEEMDQDRRNPKYVTEKKDEAVREKSFSPVEVTNLVAKARLMMRKEVDKRAEAEGGWRVADGEDARRKDREVARGLINKELAADNNGEICWQCNEKGTQARDVLLGCCVSTVERLAIRGGIARN